MFQKMLELKKSVAARVARSLAASRPARSKAAKQASTVIKLASLRHMVRNTKCKHFSNALHISGYGVSADLLYVCDACD